MITNVSFILKIEMHSCLSFNSTNHLKFPFVYGDSETKSIKVTKEEQNIMNEIFLFPGLVHQLSLQGETKSVSELRQDTAQEMRDNSDHYLPFLSLSPNQFQVVIAKTNINRIG